MSRLRILLHAPTADALIRARSNASNILAAEPDAQVEIIVNAEGAKAAVESVDAETSGLVRYCSNSLKKQGLSAPAGAEIIGSAVVYLAEKQGEGWSYIRA